MELHDYIKLKDSEATGQITRILSRNKVEVALDNGFSLTVQISKLELIPPPEKEENRSVKKPKIAMPPPRVDLHIEHLTTAHRTLTNAEKIILQLNEFERQLDAAIGSGMLEITFVHGVGAGKLREEIHKRLRREKQIKSFMDAQWDRGATLVKFY